MNYEDAELERIEKRRKASWVHKNNRAAIREAIQNHDEAKIDEFMRELEDADDSIEDAYETFSRNQYIDGWSQGVKDGGKAAFTGACIGLAISPIVIKLIDGIADKIKKK